MFITAGTSEGIELALSALVDEGGEVLVPMPTYPLYTAVLAKLGARARYYRTDPARGWMPDLDHLREAGHAGDARARRHRSEQPDRRVYSDARRGARCSTSPTATAGDSRRRGLRRSRLRRPGRAARQVSIPTRAIISFSSLSKAYLAPGWRTGWMAVGRSPRLDDVVAAVKKLADGRLCSTVPMQYAVAAALTGDRSHQPAFRDALEGARDAHDRAACRRCPA